MWLLVFLAVTVALSGAFYWLSARSRQRQLSAHQDLRRTGDDPAPSAAEAFDHAVGQES